MDWNDEIFNREDLASHIHGLGIELDDAGFQTLIDRSTPGKKSRTGNEFGFKPMEISIDQEGESPFNDKQLPSSFWIRFREEWFQIRAFCRDQPPSKTFRPYECRIPFRDIMPNGVRLFAQYPWGEDTGRVLVRFFIWSRRPARYSHYLERVLTIGREPIFDRHATEADFFHSHETELEAGPITAVGNDPRLLVQPGLWTVYCLTLAPTIRQYKLLWMCMTRLRLIDVDAQISLAAPSVGPMPPIVGLEDKDFETRYLVEGLLSHGTVTVPEVPDLLASINKYHPTLRLAILEGLFRWTQRKPIVNDIRDVARRVTPQTQHTEHFLKMRRCLITPTRCLLMPPVLETSNALLRAHQAHLDRFIRVQFVDEDGDFPASGETLVIDNELQGMEGVFARMQRALNSGIMIAGRLYVFVTFGESQSRERQCFMIAEDGDFSVANILAWMGDLSRERNIAKHAARQGLTLSTTRGLNLPLRISKTEDISHNGYTFTDGSGECSQRLIDRCARMFGYETSSAIHGRIGGIKGVWHAVPPAKDEKMDENEIFVRRSQIKFKSPHIHLNVIKVAAYSRATLNRQSILLLESLGIPTDTLVAMFRNEKAKIENMEPAYVRQNLAALSTFPIVQALQVGVTNDPLHENVMRVIRCRRLSDLKWKAWIEVEESTFLIGVADDTETLADGEIFCQIQPPNAPAGVITGRCTIYRNPCLHPGDIRPAIAVDCARLRHLKNVIVFSTRGARDLPNMLSGGDLDGDFYTLLWDPKLQIPDQKVFSPMDYTPLPPKLSPTPVTIEQTKEHFVNFVRNDMLGRICNTHMALADKYGARYPRCLELAELASHAVDFPKTGIPVPSTSIPVIHQYPDFMGKEYKSIRVFKKQKIESYQSVSAIGFMFREIDPEPAFEEAKDFTGDPKICGIEWREDWAGYLSVVALFKARYDFQLTGLLRRYNISEAECVAGVLLRSPKVRLQVEKDHDLRVAVREAFQLLSASAVEQANVYLEAHPLTDDQELDRQVWALAAYKLTHASDFDAYRPDWSAIEMEMMNDEIDDALEELHDHGLEEKRLVSYPWLFPQELFALRRR